MDFFSNDDTLDPDNVGDDDEMMGDYDDGTVDLLDDDDDDDVDDALFDGATEFED